jgi:hypothetical protein
MDELISFHLEICSHFNMMKSPRPPAVLLAISLPVRGQPEATLRTPQQYQHRMEDYERDYIGSVPVSWARNPDRSALRDYWIRRKGELGYLGEAWEERLARLCLLRTRICNTRIHILHTF